MVTRYASAPRTERPRRRRGFRLVVVPRFVGTIGSRRAAVHADRVVPVRQPSCTGHGGSEGGDGEIVSAHCQSPTVGLQTTSYVGRAAARQPGHRRVRAAPAPRPRTGAAGGCRVPDAASVRRRDRGVRRSARSAPFTPGPGAPRLGAWGGHRVGVACPEGLELLPFYENLAERQLLRQVPVSHSLPFYRKHTFSSVCCGARAAAPSHTR